MKTTVLNPLKAATLIGLGLAIAAMSVYVAEVDDAPGAAVLGLLLLTAGVVLGLRAARNRLPVWATRAAIAAGLAAAAFAAFLSREVGAAAPLFPPAQDVPSVADPAPVPPSAAVTRARAAVHAAMVEQNLPGVSVAVGAGGRVVWAEGFGWRDVATRTPVTPKTRFNIGTAASAVAGSVAPLGLTDSGTDPAEVWSPEHVGEPEEDFPLFTLLRHVVFEPLGLAAPTAPLPGERATFYVPRSDDDPRRGRRPMYMRDLACCVDGKAFYSTPADLVTVALATRPGRLDGTLAGGRVMSLVPAADADVVVAVTSNIAYADTAALAERVGAAFAHPAR